jgi:hypothetical protein
MRNIIVGCAAGLLALAVIACGEDESSSSPSNPSPIDLGGSTSSSSSSGSSGGTTTPPSGADAGSEGGASSTRGGFIEKVVDFKPGKCAGFGAPDMPQIVLGPPHGEGLSRGSLDVISLGTGGEIVLSFESNPIVDGPGIDFIVFENAFYASGDTTKPFAELAEVSVSEDGVTFTPFPCTATEYPFGDCAGWRPVTATSEATALDSATSGGDQYDLAKINVKRVRFVKIVDKTNQRCTSQGPFNNGFDLDAIAALNREK